MSVLSMFRRLRGSIRTSAFEQDMEAELRHHMELETEAGIARGMTPDAARDAARRSFGSVALVKDDCRESWGVRTIDMLSQDLRFAVRNLRKYPSYPAVVLLTLALGIGANTAIFSVVHAVLLRPLPYANGDRLVEIRHDEPKIGVINDAHDYGLNEKPTDELYRSFAQTPGPLNGTLFVRTAVDPGTFARRIPALVHEIDARQPVSRIRTLEAIRSRSLAPPRLTAMLVTLFAGVALIITAAGIAGVVSFSVKQRTTEIGVRMALGAPRSSVVRMIVRQGLTPVTLGLACGLADALLMTRVVANMLFAVEPTDPITYAAVIATLAAVAALACLAPARRAAAIDPMRALRAD